MRNRMDSAITVVSLLIGCLIFIGCSPIEVEMTLDSGSALMQPTFCLYQDRYSHERCGITRITVWKAIPAPENKKRVAFSSQWVDSLSVWINSQRVWHLEYKSPDTLIKRLLGWQSTFPVSCLIYGEVPPGYQEVVKAISLESKELYRVRIDGDGKLSDSLGFIIRLDGRGIPERLEYYKENFLITNPSYFTGPRDDLKLY